MTAVTCNAAQPRDRLAPIRPQPEPGGDAERHEEYRGAVVDEPAIDEGRDHDHGGRGQRRRHREPAAEEQGPRKAIVIRTSSQAGPSAPFGSGARTAIESIQAIAARISASTQNRRTSEERRVTRPGASRVVGSRPGQWAGLELAAVDRDPLAHADQAVAAALAAAVSGAVVGDGQLDVAVAVADDHLGALCARVLDRVGQALLDESVGGQVDARRQGLRRLPRSAARPASPPRASGRSGDRGARGWAGVRAPEPRRVGGGRRPSAASRRAPPGRSARRRAALRVPSPDGDWRRRRAADAWTVITLTLWPTTSCSSRAMRVRSSATASRACSTRSCSARASRCFASSASWNLRLSPNPIAHATVKTTDVKTKPPTPPSGSLLKMIAVTPIPNASPAIAWVRSRMRPNRTKTAIAVRRGSIRAGMSRSSTNELAATTTTAGNGRAERESPAREERQRHPQDGEDVEPERPERPVLDVLGEDDLDDADDDGDGEQRVEPVPAGERPEPLPVHALKVLRGPAGRLVREDDSPGRPPGGR